MECTNWIFQHESIPLFGRFGQEKVSERICLRLDMGGWQLAVEGLSVLFGVIGGAQVSDFQSQASSLGFFRGGNAALRKASDLWSPSLQNAFSARMAWL